MVYQFNITLSGVSPAIWREIHVDAEMGMDELHYIIQTAMLWSAEFGYEFQVNGKHIGDPDMLEEPSDDLVDSVETRISEVFSGKGSKGLYLYDDWAFDIEVINATEPVEGREYPFCAGGARNSPFEECGDPEGYEAFLELLNDHGNPERAKLIEDIGGEFDPEAFDPEDINGEFNDPDHWEDIDGEEDEE